MAHQDGQSLPVTCKFWQTCCMGLCSQAEKANIEAVKCAQIAQQAGHWVLLVCGFGFGPAYCEWR